MAKILNVYFHERIVGELKQDDAGDMVFTYLPDWLKDKAAIAISYSLPLQEKTFKRKQCRAFFAGILPEANQRKLIAKTLGISANNDFTLLERIGGECAGAISFYPPGVKLQPKNVSYLELKNHELASILRELPYNPLLAGKENIRLSLAGVQDKIAVYVNAENISLPLNGAPSTHILKPDNGVFDGVIFNEAFCLELGRKVGLPTAKTVIKKVEDINYLLIERYDRQKISETPSNHEIRRLHQEDFCQALGIVSENKYQNEGGPALRQCFQLLREISAIPVVDINNLIDAVIFNFLIGNCDAHGKNFSLLYQDQIRLAPFYDLVSTIYYQHLSTNMAMKLGGEYRVNRIKMENFEIFADEVGLAKAGIRKRVIDLTEAVLSALVQGESQNPVTHSVSQLIKTRCTHVLNEKNSK